VRRLEAGLGLLKNKNAVGFRFPGDRRPGPASRWRLSFMLGCRCVFAAGTARRVGGTFGAAVQPRPF
jgi:hypothetical protein